MALILSHGTALEYWLSPKAAQVLTPKFGNVHYFADPNRLQSFSGAETKKADSSYELFVSPRKNGIQAWKSDQRSFFRFAERWADGFSKPYHILLLDQRKRPKEEGFVCHSVSGAARGALHRSLLRLDDQTYVVSPELCFLQMAQSLSRVQLVRTGFDLASQYSFLPDGSIAFRLPVTSSLRLERYLRLVEGMRGLVNARWASKFVCDNSASPRETELAMLLCLPCHCGGYGLPNPRLNEQVAIESKYQHLFSSNYYVCDLLWKEARFALEYDSDQFHVGSDRIAHDSERRSALDLLGTKVVSVTNHQIKNVQEMDKIARLATRCLNKRFHADHGYDYRQRQRQLRKEILWSHGLLGSR